MTKRMLIDATHAEETRVAVVDQNRLIEFDYESKFRKPLKGSIFLAKVTRVEPSLQAAFVNFGGNRHGFLPFSEIHPDYFRIPISDREALLAEQDELMREVEEEQEKAEEENANNESISAEESEDILDDEPEEIGGEAPNPEEEQEAPVKTEKPRRGRRKKTESSSETQKSEESPKSENDEVTDNQDDTSDTQQDQEKDTADPNGNIKESEEEQEENDTDGNKNQRRRGRRGGRGRYNRGGGNKRAAHRSRQVEVLGGTEYDESDQNNASDRARFALRRKYKIQEVIKRGQIMLIQVSREERGNKGAAVSSYLSLPGRYGVLMPNSPRAGGVSRKIANPKDRARLRDMLKEMDVPKGMSVILRTAGVARTKTEIKRDIDYLMRLWGDIRELTLNSSAPSMIYEEADLMKRAIRDIYTREIEDIMIAGNDGYNAAKKFMKMMIPSHAKRIKEYTENIPLFHKHKVESQISEIGEPNARLKSGGYLVINPTEALVSIDVNSGRATKERHIEETALNTNLEAAEEVARQLRLRDLGGLVVVDFIDMEDRRNNARVERKLKEALSTDRARIQIGRISSFGLLEMSRQRLNPSLTEAQFETCPNCDGVGNIRTPDATTIMLLRAIEDEGIKNRAAELIAHVSNRAALYLLNNKRTHLDEIEQRYDLRVLIRVDDTMSADKFRIEVSKPADNNSAPKSNTEEQDEQNPKEDRDSNRRSRGRRGGRGRGRNREQNETEENKSENSEEQQSSPVKEKPEAETENSDNKSDKEEQKPKRTRRPAQKAKAEDVKDNASSDDGTPKTETEKPKRTRTQKKPDNSTETTEVEKPKKRPGRPRKKTTEDKTEAQTSEAEKEKAEKTTPGKKLEASNDTKPAKQEPETNHAAEFETINEAPKKKKKGWWNRLVE